MLISCYSGVSSPAYATSASLLLGYLEGTQISLSHVAMAQNAVCVAGLPGMEGLCQLPVGWTLHTTTKRQSNGLDPSELAFVCPATGATFDSLDLALKHARDRQLEGEQQQGPVASGRAGVPGKTWIQHCLMAISKALESVAQTSQLSDGLCKLASSLRGTHCPPMCRCSS